MANTDPFGWITLGAIRRDPPPEVKFIWGDKTNGLMQEHSFTMLHSSEKQGKSMFALNLAVAGARADADFLGITIRPGGFRTLILQCEVHNRAMYERFQQMLAHGDLTDEQSESIIFNSIREVTLTNPLLFYFFKKKIRQWKPDIVVIDPLAHMLTEDENSNVAVGRGLAPLLKLRDNPGTGIFVIHHDSKVSDGNSGRPAHQRSRGANRLTADPDSILSLTPMKRCGGPTAKLSCKPRYGGEMTPFRVRLNESTFWFERYSQEQEHGEVLQTLLREAGGSAIEAELIAAAAERWNLHDEQHDHRTVRKRIARAVADGLLTRAETAGAVVYSLATQVDA
jgi:hypothetical protein